jgi:hypothetical protein
VVPDHSGRRHDASHPLPGGGKRTVSDAPGSTEQPPGPATDLVEYLVVALPELGALRTVVPALTDLARAEQIRVLDVVVLARGRDGALDVLEVADVDDLAPLRDLAGDLGLLSENDLRLASRAVRAGEVALVVVAEDRWAEQLSTAARRAGGQIAAGERISLLQREAAAPEPDDNGG